MLLHSGPTQLTVLVFDPAKWGLPLPAGVYLIGPRTGPERLHWLDGLLSEIVQRRNLKQAQIRACSGGLHTWSSNGAIPQFH
ncbi:hypothetical protein NQZ68_022979 [Dissostichus eleginoides]|nr:hypothetical protein NQZ68_022979 [Dissostichus eleginoides]